MQEHLLKIADKVELKIQQQKDITVTNKNNNTGGLIGTMTSSDLENVHIIGGNVQELAEQEHLQVMQEHLISKAKQQ